ncbi:T9SS type A sorting domain-containing protein [candidate division KSB1 bacterium]|nr:T9SS type A sorting domain-containing protein [candidate division KSB1 bacterium]
MKILSCVLIVIINTTVFATEYMVSSAQDIDDAMSGALPGDTLTMIDGSWVDQEINFRGHGVAGDSIVLRAKTPGHVVLNGNSRLEIDGSYLKVDGLRFVGGYNTDNAIEFDNDSQHCRVTNTQVSEFNPPNKATRYHWIIINGFKNRLDHCYFSGKRHSGVTVLVRFRKAPYGYHRIDHNHFAHKPEGNGNGYESLKVSSGAYSDLKGNIIAEYNYFYRCNGEMEIVSNKCLNNIYRYNTFVECQGTFTLRQGTHCIVEGNYFFGNNIPNTGGIRIMHRGHKIINNYFQDLAGDGQRSAIILYTGMDHSDYIPGEGGHVRADSTLIAHNTIVNCEQGVYSGFLDLDDAIRLAPKDNIFANNIISMNDEAVCYVLDPNYPEKNPFWQGNILNGDHLGNVPESGYSVTDPELTLLNGWYQISESSPAVDAGIGDYPEVTEDIDGIIRDEKKDVGADELGSGFRQPLTEKEVGPLWFENTALPVILAVNKSGDGKGEVALDPAGGVYDMGTRVKLTAMPDEDNTFVGWGGDLQGMENPVSIIMDRDKIITAEFKAPVRYNLAVWTTGSGTVEFDPPGGSYPESTMVKITAIPEDNWAFSAWGGELSGSSNPDSVLMDSDKALTVTFAEMTGIEIKHATPLTYRLEANYPNPFNPVTTIPFVLEKSGYTTLDVYDVLGHKVAELLSDNLDAGTHNVRFDASELSSGVYFYCIRSGYFGATRKMILIR